MIDNERLEEVAQGLQAHLNSHLAMTVVPKERDTKMQVIASIFDAAEDVRLMAAHLSIDVPLHLPTGAKFLSEFVTTTGLEIAAPEADLTPDGALRRILWMPHEWTHGWQYKRGADMGWVPKEATHSLLYVLSVLGGDGAEYLGHVEGDAYAVTEAMRAFLSGRRRPVEEVTDGLRRHYSLVGGGLIVAEQTLLSHYDTLDDGGVPNVTSARLALEWMETNAADLKGNVPC